MPVRVITPPAVEPISLDEAKLHLNVDHTDHDELIRAYIRAARARVDGKDGYLGRALVTQTLELVLDGFPDFEIEIPLPPLQSVVSVKYDDSAGNEQTLPLESYEIDNVSEPGVIVPIGDWPASADNNINTLRIRYIAGYISGDSPSDLTDHIPADIKAGMLLHIGHMYANREEVVVGTSAVPLPRGSEILFGRYRVQLGMA